MNHFKMKRLVVLLCLFTVFPMQNSEDVDLAEEESEESRPMPFIRIDRVRIHGEKQYMQVSTRIHENRLSFDIFVMLNREIGSNHLIMNVRMRARFVGAEDYTPILELKRIDFCQFLTEYSENSIMRFVFKKSMQLSDIIVCPVRVGNYSMVNINVADSVYPENLQYGLYKFFIEIVEVTGELPKVFAMMVITEINKNEKEA